MKLMAMSLWAGLLGAGLAAGATAPELNAGDRSAGSQSWDPEKAAQYLDARMDLWFAKAAKLKTGQSKTVCVSCHAVVPYLLARPALRQAMKATQPTPQEQKLLAEIAQRGDTFGANDPLYAPHEKQSRGTEAVLNALILAAEDARQNRKEPSEAARKAFRQMWELQRSDGAWDWLDAGLEPDETADGQYYGAALAAFAWGTAPGVAGSQDGDTASHVSKLCAYLNTNYDAQNLYRRAWMLLASTRLPGLLRPEQREQLTAELRHNQNEDGGWSLYRLGPWRWSRAAPPFAPPGNPEATRSGKSDGYATGLVAYVLRQAGTPSGDPALRKATGWLKANQQEVVVEQQRCHCWRTPSLNHDRENGGARGEPWKQMMMWDMATAFAVLALAPED